MTQTQPELGPPRPGLEASPTSEASPPPVFVHTYLAEREDHIRVSFESDHSLENFISGVQQQERIPRPTGVGYQLMTCLERGRGSERTQISIRGGVPIPIIKVLLTCAKEIEGLDLECHLWADVEKFSRDFQSLLTLDRLTLNVFRDRGLDPTNPHSLFNRAINLKTFCIHSTSPFINYFNFPGLTSFELKLSTTWKRLFSGLQLLDFLAASPLLEAVCIKIFANISLEGIPPERTVVLSHVKDLSLTVSDGGQGYKLAAYLKCPSVFSMVIRHKSGNGILPTEIFPALDSWKKIVGRCTSNQNPVEVTLDLTTSPTISCTLIFLCSDMAAIRLKFEVIAKSIFPPVSEEKWYMSVLTQATRTILKHQGLASVKRLAISHGLPNPSPSQTLHIKNEARELFESLDPLDELAIYSCDPRPYLHESEPEQIRFPPIERLTICRPSCFDEDEGFAKAIEEFADSQKKAGRPLNSVHVLIRMGSKPVEEDKLKGLVGSVKCYSDDEPL